MIVRHAGIAMTFGNAAGALAVSVVLLGLASDSRSSRSRPTDLAANQVERHAPASMREPAARDAATPEPVEPARQPVEPAKPATPAPAAKPTATKSTPSGRTSPEGLATKESPPPPTPPPSTAGSPLPEGAPRTDTAPVAGAEPGRRPAAPSDVAPPQPATPGGRATLDLSSLEQRLRDTKAIGVFTKLSLKNQVDDLLQQFREFHKSPDQALLTKLRQTFDLLLLKVLSLLQDGDPALARDISSSRDDLWSILSDPEKFKNVE